ncbi:MAG TPA: guanylate kinase [Gammaproteobacteria bacterium]|nr:guanylate kinase [Gammaproteobacteria bacterium]
MSSEKATRTAPGRLYVISAPSGAGKTSLVRALMAADPSIAHSISYTTRPPRPNEIHGRDYFFVDRETFRRMVERGEFLEHAEVFDNLYGTSRAQVEALLREGRNVILEIDWQGARQVRRAMPECVSVFILPPSLAELRRRLLARAAEERQRLVGPAQAATEAERRFRDAVSDMRHWEEFDYVVVNDVFDTALAELQAILRGAGEASRRDRPALRPLVATLLA